MSVMKNKILTSHVTARNIYGCLNKLRGRFNNPA